MASRSRTLLWAIAVVVFFLLGIGGALVRGFWGVSQDCHAWANSHGYQPHRTSGGPKTAAA